MSKHTYKLIDHYFKEQLLAAKSSLQTHPPQPTICICRDPGSGGKPIAELVAQRLGFDFYDEKLIDSIAKSAKRRTSVIRRVDEKTRNVIQDFIHNLLDPEYISDSTYINHLIKTVLSISTKGGAVFLGRGTNFIVPRDQSFSALITAPKKLRVQRAIQYEHISPSQALERIAKHSQERRAFVSQYFSRRYTSPANYDLILNSEFYSIEKSSQVLLSAIKKKFPNVKIIQTNQAKSAKLK